MSTRFNILIAFKDSEECERFANGLLVALPTPSEPLGRAAYSAIVTPRREENLYWLRNALREMAEGATDRPDASEPVALRVSVCGSRPDASEPVALQVSVCGSRQVYGAPDWAVVPDGGWASGDWAEYIVPTYFPTNGVSPYNPIAPGHVFGPATGWRLLCSMCEVSGPLCTPPEWAADSIAQVRLSYVWARLGLEPPRRQSLLYDLRVEWRTLQVETWPFAAVDHLRGLFRPGGPGLQRTQHTSSRPPLKSHRCMVALPLP